MPRNSRQLPHPGGPSRESPSRVSGSSTGASMSTVELLGGTPAQRAACYADLEACHDMDVAVACVPQLCRLLALPAEEVSAIEFRQVNRVLATLAMYGDDGRVTAAVYRQEWSSYWTAEHNVLGQILRKQPAELTVEDVLPLAGLMVASYAVWNRGLTYSMSCGTEQPVTLQLEFECFMAWLSTPFMGGRPDSPSDAYNTRIIELALDVVAGPDNVHELSGPERHGTWTLIHSCVFGRRELCLAQLQDESTRIIDAAVAFVRSGGNHLAHITTTSDDVWHSLAACTVQELAFSSSCTGFDPVPELLRSGYFDILIEGLRAFQSAEFASPEMDGDSRNDRKIDVVGFFYTGAFNLSMLDLSGHEEAWSKLEASADALAYAMRNDVGQCWNMGLTTRSFFTMVCANVFGRSESETAMITFQQSEIDSAMKMCQELLDPAGWGGGWPVVVTIAKVCLNLSISDSNKELLLKSDMGDPGGKQDFISHLLTGLGFELYLENPKRVDTPDALKEALQKHYAECILQIALYPPGADALKASDSPVLKTLQRLTEEGWSDEARHSAKAALMTLDPSASSVEVMPHAANTEHVMLSYCWAQQTVIKRVNTSLKARGYNVWIDIEMMKGSTVEAMAEAVEGCAVIVVGVSREYKESTNCRLEAQYAHQCQKQMVPVMLEEEYKANGWLGFILGTKLWVSFCGKVLLSESAFEGKVDELAVQLGENGEKCRVAPAPARPVPAKPLAAVAPTALNTAAPPQVDEHVALDSARPSGRRTVPPSQQAPSHGGTLSSGAIQADVQGAHQQQSGPPQGNQAAGGITEVLALLSTQLDQADTLKQEVQSKLEAKLGALAVSAGQLEAVQARLRVLHKAQLLSDEEQHRVEDTVADCIVNMAMGAVATSAVIQLVRLSEWMADDRSFARQLQRKF